jgi:hypothetical protein
VLIAKPFMAGSAAARSRDAWPRLAPSVSGSSTALLPQQESALERHHEHTIENMLAKLKDSRRIRTRYDRCAHTFMSAICIVIAIVTGSGERCAFSAISILPDPYEVTQPDS